MAKYRWWIVAAVVLAACAWAGSSLGMDWLMIGMVASIYFGVIRLVFWLLSKVLNFGKSAVRGLTGSAPKS